MTSRVIDTNVLRAASGHANQLGRADYETVLDWVETFRTAATAVLVLDLLRLIETEYFKGLSDQDYGYQVLREKLSSARYVPVDMDAAGDIIIPVDLKTAVRDEDDHKFVAAAISDAGTSPIVNACDGDWFECETALAGYGVTVEHLLPHLRP